MFQTTNQHSNQHSISIHENSIPFVWYSTVDLAGGRHCDHPHPQKPRIATACAARAETEGLSVLSQKLSKTT